MNEYDRIELDSMGEIARPYRYFSFGVQAALAVENSQVA